MKIPKEIACPASAVLFFLTFYHFSFGEPIDTKNFAIAALLSFRMTAGIGYFTTRGK